MSNAVFEFKSSSVEESVILAETVYDVFDGTVILYAYKFNVADELPVFNLKMYLAFAAYKYSFHKNIAERYPFSWFCLSAITFVSSSPFMSTISSVEGATRVNSGEAFPSHFSPTESLVVT